MTFEDLKEIVERVIVELDEEAPKPACLWSDEEEPPPGPIYILPPPPR